MSMERNSPFVIDFLECYRQHSCLWDVHSKDYSNRNKKTEAIKCLLQLSQKYHSEADEFWVRKKIQNFRTVFKKEFNKIQNSKRSGAGTDQIYQPTLWYYDLLTFTIGQIEYRPSITIDSFEESCVSESVTPNASDDQNDQWNSTVELLDSNEQSQPCQNDVLALDNDQVSTPRQHSRRKRPLFQRVTNKTDESQKNQQLTSVLAAAQNVFNSKPDEAECVGATVACKLRKLARDQRSHAERLIFEVLFKANENELNVTSKIISEYIHRGEHFPLRSPLPVPHYIPNYDNSQIHSQRGRPANVNSSYFNLLESTEQSTSTETSNPHTSIYSNL